MKNKKPIIITSIVVLLLLVVVGVTYAFFSYESGTKSDIVTGQIYMNYEETSTISLTGVFPETKAQALARQDENGVFEFSITGRNTSKYPVYYEIDLLDGGVITGKTAASTKILPEHVMIYLERDGEPLVDGVTYEDFNNRRIYADTIPANQTSNIEHKYTLRMWIDENVTISDTDTSADYTTTEWNDSYASLKVRVVGDFEYKEVATDASCFQYRGIVPEGYVAYDYPIITLDTSDEKVEACMASVTEFHGNQDISIKKDGYKSFCEGTGTYENQQFGTINLNQFVNSYLGVGMPTDFMMGLLPVVTDINIETRYYELNTSEESVNACKQYMLNDINGGKDYSDAQDGYQSYCEGKGTVSGFSIFEDINEAHHEISNLTQKDILIQVETPKGVEIEITSYDETCGMDVVIPSVIEGLPVTRIADGTERGYGDIDNFSSRNLTSVKLPNTLEYIGAYAFYGNSLTELIIPNSVITIGSSAFYSNSLTELIIPDSVITIGSSAFGDNYSSLRIVTLGKNLSQIDSGAFGLSYRWKSSLEKIVNKSGNAFNWTSIFGFVGSYASSYIVQDPGIVATGTYIYNHTKDGNKTVLITSE